MLRQQPGCWDFRTEQEEEGEEWKVIMHSRTLSLNFIFPRYLIWIINLCNLLMPYMPAYPSVCDVLSSINAGLATKADHALRRYGRVEVISTHSYPQHLLDTLAMQDPNFPHTICYWTRVWVSTRGLFEGLNTVLSHKIFTLYTLYIAVCMLQCQTIKEEQYKLTILHKNIILLLLVYQKYLDK
jgi:hypothetical protein